MKRSLKGLLLALTVISPVFASDSNNKTHLNVRLGRTTAAACTTFHRMLADKNDDKLGGNVQATAFYARSTNGSHLARSFGANGTNAINVIADGSSNPNLKTFPAAGNVWNELLLHTHSRASNALAGVLSFDPKQTVYGVRFDYVQRFDKWLDGLYFSLTVPIVRVRNDLNLKIVDGQKDGGTAGLNAAEGVKIANLVSGRTITRTNVGDEAVNAQKALKYGKMCSNTKTGFDDIEARVGWKFMEGRKYNAGVNVALVLPTGEKQNPEFLWSVRTGETKWGLGLGADASALLWEMDDQNLIFLADLQYKYLIPGTERRTLGLNEVRYADASAAGYDIMKNPLMSQYYLVGEAGKMGLEPLANVSTVDVSVRPGSQLDGTFSFAYNNAGFTLDLGYNVFWKEAERVKIKGEKCKRTTEDGNCLKTCGLDAILPACGWTETKYGVAGMDYDASNEFAENGSDTLQGTTGSEGFIKAADLNTRNAETDAQLIHKLFGGVGYYAKDWKYPVLVGVGAAYEVPSSNRNTLEGYSFWAKAGVAF